MNEVMGKPWAIPILAGKGVEWVQWRDNNRDMQFMEYQTWLLKKACAVYQIAPRRSARSRTSTARPPTQEGTNESKSIEPILSLLKDAIDVEVIGEHGEGVGDWVEFEWDEEGESAEEINAKFQPPSRRAPRPARSGARRSAWTPPRRAPRAPRASTCSSRRAT
jgi:hypothetical protein